VIAATTLRSTSLRAWIAALVTVLAASVAMFATAGAAAGKAMPEVTAIMVRLIHAKTLQIRPTAQSGALFKTGRSGQPPAWKVRFLRRVVAGRPAVFRVYV
jgi:hypothetical protein